MFCSCFSGSAAPGAPAAPFAAPSAAGASTAALGAPETSYRGPGDLLNFPPNAGNAAPEAVPLPPPRPRRTESVPVPRPPIDAIATSTSRSVQRAVCQLVHQAALPLHAAALSVRSSGRDGIMVKRLRFVRRFGYDHHLSGYAAALTGPARVQFHQGR